MYIYKMRLADERILYLESPYDLETIKENISNEKWIKLSHVIDDRKTFKEHPLQDVQTCNIVSVKRDVNFEEIIAARKEDIIIISEIIKEIEHLGLTENVIKHMNRHINKMTQERYEKSYGNAIYACDAEELKYLVAHFKYKSQNGFFKRLFSKKFTSN